MCPSLLQPQGTAAWVRNGKIARIVSQSQVYAIGLPKGTLCSEARRSNSKCPAGTMSCAIQLSLGAVMSLANTCGSILLELQDMYLQFVLAEQPDIRSNYRASSCT